MSDGSPVKSLAGARLVTRIVSLRIPNRQQPPSDPKSVPLSSKALNLRMYLRSHLTMWCSRMSSASRQQHVCPHTGPWDCAIDLLPGTTLPKGGVYPLSILEHKTMASTSRRLSSKGSSNHPSWLWRSGITGWREKSFHSPSSPTKRTSCICGMPKDSIPVKHAGHSSSQDLISPSAIAEETIM